MAQGVPGFDVAMGPPAEPQQAPPADPYPKDLRAWADADEARGRIGDLDPGDRFGSVRMPFQAVDHDAYVASIQGAGIPARSLTAPIAKVNLADLVATQGTVNPERLAMHVDDANLIPIGSRSPGHGMLVDRPVVVRLGGVMYVHDGHHRLTARALRGATTAKVRFVDLDGG